MKRLALVLLLLLFCVSAWAASPYATQNVFLVVMDGVRYSDTFGDPTHANIPHLWNDLRPQGTLFANYYNTGVTVTRQSHSTMISGTWQTCPNGGPRMTMPTAFDYFRDELGVPQSKTLAVFGKARYAWQEYSSFPAYGSKFAPAYISGVGEGSVDDDKKVLATVEEQMAKNHPNLVFINLGFTDHSGHLGDYNVYLQAIKNVDEIFYNLWNKIQSDPVYKDKTTVIFVNDHGRHDDAHGGFRNHGDACEGCRHIMMLVLGPDTKKGAQVDRRVLQVDVAPTIGELLGFQTPLAQGDTIKEAITGYQDINKKEARTQVAKEAVRIKHLADRDMAKTVADQVLATYKPADLPADASSETLMRGMLAAYDQTKDARYLDFVKNWLSQTPAPRAGEVGAAYVGSVKLFLSKRTNDPALADSAVQDARGLVGLLDGNKAGDAAPDVCAFLARVAGPGKEQLTASAAKAMTAYLAAHAQLTGKSLSRTFADATEVAVAAPDDAALRKAYLILSARVLAGLSEEGAIWPDAAISAENLSALAMAPHIPWWAEMKQVKAKDQQQVNQMKALAGFTKPDITSLVAALGKPEAKTPRVVFINAVAGPGKRGRPFSMNCLKYAVDEKGSISCSDQRMGAGAMLYALCQPRQGKK